MSTELTKAELYDLLDRSAAKLDTAVEEAHEHEPVTTALLSSISLVAYVRDELRNAVPEPSDDE